MNILGIDPGIARLGWGLVTINENSVSAKSFGCITTSEQKTLPMRLQQIYRDLLKLISRLQPDILAIEEIFFATNAKTVIPVAQARGIVLLTAAQRQLPINSYSPLAVKKTICGDGHADKNQVQKMITRILHFKQVPKPDDVADALAVALTHAYSYKLKEKLK